MKYQKTINQISNIFARFSPEEQLELIKLSPVLNYIYQLGAKEFMKFVEQEVDKKGISSKYVHPYGWEVDDVSFDGDISIDDFIKQWNCN